MALTRVHLIRHGEVENPAGIVYGRLPGFHLSDRGRRQAAAAAEALRATGAQVQRVVSSPLERARESAEPVAEVFGVEVETNEDFLEATNRLQGETFDVSLEILAHPAAWRYLANPFRPSWGEPYRDMLARMLRGIRATADLSGEELVVVSHQAPIYTVARHAAGKRLFHDPRGRECAFSSITTIEVRSDASLRLVGYRLPAASD